MVDRARRIKVCLGKQLIHVGDLFSVENSGRESVTFRYAQTWLDDKLRCALSPHLPLVAESYNAAALNMPSTLPGVIDDGAPDDWGKAIINQVLGRRRCTNLEYLLECDDFTRIGALRYLDEEGTVLAPPRKEAVPRMHDLEHLVWAAQASDSDPSQYRELRNDLMGAIGSLGGARPKINVVDHEGRLSIAKLARLHEGYPVEQAEVMTLRLAEKCGLRVAKSQLVPTKTKPVSLIERFDRSGEGRIHYASARSFLGLSKDMGGSYVEMAEHIKAHCTLVATRELHELHQRLIFTILVTNTDDHMKNHGFVLNRDPKGRYFWQLLPAFDINPNPSGNRFLSTPIEEGRSNINHEASLETAIAAAAKFNLDPSLAQDKAKRMAEIINSEWKSEAQQVGMSEQQIKDYRPAFEHREMTRALSFTGL